MATNLPIAGHSMATPELTVVEALDLFAALGLDGVELIWQDEYRSGIAEGAGRSELEAIRSKSADLGMPVVCLTPYMSKLGDPDAALRRRDIDRFFKCIEAAAYLGAGWVRVYAGEEGRREEREQRVGRLAESLRELHRAAAGAGIVLCIETHFGTLASTAANTVEVVDASGSDRVSVLYDQANLSFAQAEDFPEALALLQGRIAYCHVKDFALTRERPFQASSVSHVDADERNIVSRIVGEGVVPWAAILSRLVAGGYSGWLSLEYERRWHAADLPPAEQGLAASARHIRAILAGIG